MMGLMFFSFLNINFKKISQNLHHIKKPSITLAIIHILSPLIILTLKPYLDPQIFLGLIIVTIIPSGVSVVFLSSLFKGNPNTALVITFFSNILSPITIPALLYIFTKLIININYLSIALTIVKLILIPLLLAMLFNQLKFTKKLAKNANTISTLILFVLIIGIISPVQYLIIHDLKLTFMLIAIVIGLTTINFFAGYSLGKTREEKVTYGICSNYKSYVLASIIALSNFDPMVALPAAIYALVNNLFLIPMQMLILKHK
jgi:BASS family bile acid:Na+ symporter